ncbi:hypothetical protein HDU79_003602 [Rhizoclosmatium sp. JEL0117]|nr:hypothetical protein HDU79_003602 [Rhizoclosmatium sp. JEL0117]
MSDHPESKRSANAGSSLTPKITISRSRAESVASRSSTESSKPPPSPTFSANAALPPLAIKAVEDITTLSIQKIKAPSYLESKKLNTLHAAVHAGDLRKFKALVADKTRDINKLDSYHGFSALHLAVDENKYDFATLLIDPALALGEKEAKNKEAFVNSMLKVINLNTANREGRTPLIMVDI